MPVTPSSRCRACKQQIVWAATEHGRLIPVDPIARPDGNLELLRMSGVLVARVLTPEREREIQERLLAAHRDGVTPELALHVTHFSTCPAADTFRRRAAKQPTERRA